MDGPQRDPAVKLPLPESEGGPERNLPSTSPVAPAAPAAPNLPSYDRAFWTRLIANVGSLRISTTIRALGLKCSNQHTETKKRLPQFEHLPVRLLVNAITNVAAKLPQNADELVDVAEDETRLDADITELLADFGTKIWGRDGERTWLFEASEGVEGYENNLVFEAPMDRLV